MPTNSSTHSSTPSLTPSSTTDSLLTKGSSFVPLRDPVLRSPFGTNDTLVIFGEVFDRGYVNGLIEEAKKQNMKVIYSTVGRRDDDGPLRPLTADELKTKEAPLINVPLEAGFDLEPGLDGRTCVDLLKGIKLSEWETAKLDANHIEEARVKGVESFRNRLKKWVQELERMLPENGHILFAHTMAGGFPRAKVVMPATNRVFKGYEERYCSSEMFWNTDIGKLCAKSFLEVTGNTFHHLIEMTTSLRQKKSKQGFQVSYVGYGYHGTEVLIQGAYKWQSYSPYLQGWAKLRLEDIAIESQKQGISACVYNAPEILTNSSSIFLGVEVSLYPLLGSLLQVSNQNPRIQNILATCRGLLKPPHTIEEILKLTDQYLTSSTIQSWSDFSKWPQHNGPEQMKLMRESSAHLIEMHTDTKKLITAELSEWVFRACGNVMLHDGWKPTSPVVWMGHDLLAKTLAKIL